MLVLDRENRPLSTTDRLTALDVSFLHLEDHGAAHMHVASVLVFDGTAPSLDELTDHIVGRLHLVPRFRQRLAQVPLRQGRPVWVDDPHFNPAYHIRHTALTRPGDEEALKRLAGRLFSQRLDRSKPLWEFWLVEGLEGARFALIIKTHHALVDGVSGVDIATILFDGIVEDAGDSRGQPRDWVPRPVPGSTQLLANALIERATVPAEAIRGVRAVLRTPRRVAGEAVEALRALGALAVSPDFAPQSPFNVPIGPHRRYSWVDADLDGMRAVKNAFGGTVNDAILTAVAGGIGRYLRAQGHDTEDLVLRAMVPVSVRTKSGRGALGNQVAAMWAPLPVGVADPRERFEQLRRAMADVKESGQAVGAQVLTELAGFAPTTILSQAARLQARQRYFNLVVTNIPGPQVPLYVLKRKLSVIYPAAPLAYNQALSIAVMSYCGRMGFGLLADFDALPALEELAFALRLSIEELTVAAGVRRGRSERRHAVKAQTRAAAVGVVRKVSAAPERSRRSR